MIADIEFDKDGTVHILDWECTATFDIDGVPEIVQGSASPEEVEEALKAFNRYYSPKEH